MICSAPRRAPGASTAPSAAATRPQCAWSAPPAAAATAAPASLRVRVTASGFELVCESSVVQMAPPVARLSTYFPPAAALGADETGWCVPCASNGCAACSDDGACTECNSYLGLVDGACVDCASPAGTRTCTKCADGEAAAGRCCPALLLHVQRPALHQPRCPLPDRSPAPTTRHPPVLQATSARASSAPTKRTWTPRAATASPAPRAAASAPPAPTAPLPAACAATHLPLTPAARAWRAPQTAPRATARPARARATLARPASDSWARRARSVRMSTGEWAGCSACVPWGVHAGAVARLQHGHS